MGGERREGGEKRERDKKKEWAGGKGGKDQRQLCEKIIEAPLLALVGGAAWRTPIS